MNREQAENLVYRHTHEDFRITREDGTRLIMVPTPDGGTALKPLTTLTNDEIRARLPEQHRAEFTGLTGFAASLNRFRANVRPLDQADRRAFDIANAEVDRLFAGWGPTTIVTESPACETHARPRTPRA